MKIVKQIAIILLSFVTLSYSGGIAITKHYCKDKIVGKAINSEVKKCKKAIAATPFSGETEYQKPSCCSTDFGFFKSTDFEKTSIAKLDAPINDALNFEPIIFQKSTTVHLECPEAPPLSRLPIYILVETYLI